jgi:acetyl-CoA carboxylase biotin carboxyl carrier protein
MDIRKIKKLIELINETGIGEIEVTSGEESVRISRGVCGPAPTYVTAAAPAALPVAAPTATAPKKPDGYSLKSPMVGTAYLSASPGDAPFVKVGQRVNVGDTVCMIEAMKMFNKIEADKAGVISARLVENEQPVEFDQPLFIIDDSE